MDVDDYASESDLDSDDSDDSDEDGEGGNDEDMSDAKSLNEDEIMEILKKEVERRKAAGEDVSELEGEDGDSDDDDSEDDDVEPVEYKTAVLGTLIPGKVWLLVHRAFSRLTIA